MPQTPERHERRPRPTSPARRGLAAGGEARGEVRRRPGPDGVQLPHVAEVAEVGQPRRRCAPDVEHDARPESLRRRHQRPDPDPALEHRGRHGQHRRHDQCGAPRLVEGAGDQLREDAAEGERPDHDADREAAPVGEPADDQLHAHRVDQRQRRPGHHPQHHGRDRAVDHGRRRQRRDRGDGRADPHQPRRVHPVGQVGDRRHQRPGHEAELHPDRQQRLADPPDLPLRTQRGRGRGRREPRRHRHHLHRRHQHQLAYGLPTVRRRRRATTCAGAHRGLGPSRTSWVTCPGSSSSRRGDPEQPHRPLDLAAQDRRSPGRRRPGRRPSARRGRPARPA